MTLYVAGSAVPAPNSLSDLTRRVCTFIDGGQQWLDHACSGSTAIYRFPDEGALLNGVQQGLHASPLVLLPRLGLLVGPMKLMSIGMTELNTLAQFEGGDDSATTTAAAQQVLIRHDLATNRDLAEGTKFLAALGVAEAPVFQGMGLTDRLVILDLSRSELGQDPTAPLPREAAAFAVEQARTPLEFVDYYQAYLQYLEGQGASSGSADQRGAAVRAGLDKLLPLTFDALNCPKVDSPSAPQQIIDTLKSFRRTGSTIGFSRMSECMQQVIAHTVFAQPGDRDAKSVLHFYLAGAQHLLCEGNIDRPRLAQDGTGSVLRVQSDTEEACLRVSATGHITLTNYRRSPGVISSQGAMGDASTGQSKSSEADT